MQTIHPFDIQKDIIHYVYEDQIFYSVDMQFDLLGINLENEKISIIIQNENFFEESIDMYQSSLMYEIRFTEKEKYYDFAPMITFATNIYFCKKIGRKIKYTPSFTKIPLLNPFDSSKKDFTRYHRSRLLLRFGISNKLCDVHNIQNFLYNNVVLQTKESKKHIYMLTEYDRFNFNNFPIKYAYLIFHCMNYFGRHDNNFYTSVMRVDNRFMEHVLDCEYYFCNLTKKYSNITFKIKKRPFDIIVIFKINDNVNNEFYRDLYGMAFETLNPKYNSSAKVYIVF